MVRRMEIVVGKAQEYIPKLWTFFKRRSGHELFSEKTGVVQPTARALDELERRKGLFAGLGEMTDINLVWQERTGFFQFSEMVLPGGRSHLSNLTELPARFLESVQHLLIFLHKKFQARFRRRDLVNLRHGFTAQKQKSVQQTLRFTAKIGIEGFVGAAKKTGRKNVNPFRVLGKPHAQAKTNRAKLRLCPTLCKNLPAAGGFRFSFRQSRTGISGTESGGVGVCKRLRLWM